MTKTQATSANGAANPEFPSLSDDALGALRLGWRWANVEDDWTKNGRIAENWDRWTGWPYMAKLTYDLTYLVRLMGKYSQEIPAWRELTGSVAELCLNRMFQYGSLHDWVEQAGLDPNCGRYPYLYYKHTIPRGYAGVYNAPGYCGNGLATAMAGLPQSFGWAAVDNLEGKPPYVYQHSPGVGRRYNPDPVYANGSSNMMYKGYALEQFAQVKAITGTTRYDGPQKLVYDEELTFDYSSHDVARILAAQLSGDVDENGSSLRMGVDCEVGKVFPICVSVGGLGMQLFDKLYGTDFTPAYLDWLDYGSKNWIAGGADPDGPVEWCVPYYDRDLNYSMKLPEQSIPLFWTQTALQMSVHDRTFAERIYEGAIRKAHVEPDGAMRIVLGPEFVGPALLDDVWGQVAALACAYEFADWDRFEALKLHVDKNYGMTRKDGEAYYTLSLDEPWPRGIPNHILQMTWAGEPGDYKKMYLEPNTAKFDQPTVEGVDFPSLTIRQACVDGAGTLHVATDVGTPGAEGQATRFRVTRLAPGRSRAVTRGGQEFGGYTEVSPTEIEISTQVGPGYFTVR
jgi:hypothetical protein